MNSLLIDDRPIMFLPGLAKLLGSVERAIVLQQIHWLSQQPHSGIEHEGQRWVWGTYEEWCEQYFSMWSPHTLGKHIRKLEQDEYLLSAQLKADEWDRTKYYRVNYKSLQSILPDPVDSIRPHPVASNQPDPVRSSISETSSETSSEEEYNHPLPPVDDRLARISSHYQNNIGPLNETMAEELKAHLTEFPPDWITGAIDEAVIYNKRSWAYVRRVLRTWERQGYKGGNAKDSNGHSAPAQVEVTKGVRDEW